MTIFHLCTIFSVIGSGIMILLFIVSILSKLTDPTKNFKLYQEVFNDYNLSKKWIYIFLIFNVICFLFYRKIKKLRLIDYYKYKINRYKDLLYKDYITNYDGKEYKKEISKYSRLLKLKLLK